MMREAVVASCVVWACVVAGVSGAEAGLQDLPEARQSTVLSFNFSNLLILLGIKLVAILALTGAGGFFGKRSLDGTWVDENDLMFLTTFLVSDDLQRHNCLSRLACLRPRPAHDLLTAASFLSRGAAFLPKMEWRWVDELKEVRRALDEGLAPHYNGVEELHCPLYSCPALPAL